MYIIHFITKLGKHSYQKEDGIVRVVFATTALGMAVNFAGLNRTINMRAPQSKTTVRSLVRLEDLQVP